MKFNPVAFYWALTVTSSSFPTSTTTTTTTTTTTAKTQSTGGIGLVQGLIVTTSHRNRSLPLPYPHPTTGTTRLHSSTTGSITGSSSSSQNPMSTSTSTTTTSTTTSSTSSSSSPAPSSASSSSSSMASTIEFQNSWIQQLSPETPENFAKSLGIEGLDNGDDDDPTTTVNRTKRPVFNGHYVLVAPTPLRQPRLILVSPDVAHNMLHLTDEQIQSDEFLQYVSGTTLPGTQSWATPYALSIMGTRYTNNCPYGTGNGYGDGRAISIGEFQNFELQLKGSGPTPFCRGADGRAVLRSSIREFLASEAMHYMGIRTTRALSLVVSEVDTVRRPWYSPGAKLTLPEDPNDPRLAKYTPLERQKLLAQLRTEKVDPNIMVQEPCAIACRVSPSFVRIGHFDLFARRVMKQRITTTDSQSQSQSQGKHPYDTTTLQWKELQDMVWHACYREFRDEAYTPYHHKNDIGSAATVLLERSAERLAEMTSEWIRVGFAQGNFNADNCLVGGHTMDYGPFGFMEEYNPLFAKWTGSGTHFGFMNQPSAGYVNYNVLVDSVVPVIVAAAAEATNDGVTTAVAVPTTDALVQRFMNRAKELFERKVDGVFRRKLGFPDDMEVADPLWETLHSLMKITRVDWTLFFRQLTLVTATLTDFTTDDGTTDYNSMLDRLIADGDQSPFYEPLSPEFRQQYLQWIQEWHELLLGFDTDNVAERMRMTNPKYILREWMLVNAYTAAANGDDSELHTLFELIQSPYEEGTLEQQSKYYRRTPEEAYMAGGTAFMSCSS